VRHSAARPKTQAKPAAIKFAMPLDESCWNAVRLRLRNAYADQLRYCQAALPRTFEQNDIGDVTMMFDPREKIALFIDGANLYATSKALGFDIDYRKMLKYFEKRGYLLRAHYYTALVEDQEFSSIRPLVDWLDYNGYRVVTKPAKEFTDAMGRRKIKGNMDMELAIDAMSLVDSVDHFVIFSGDGDFRILIEALQRKGRKVTVVSTITSQPPMVSDDVRRQCDHFVDLVTLKEEIGRAPSDRPAPRRYEQEAVDEVDL
jgi:uncharacterized LabA/DUF88 family protein